MSSQAAMYWDPTPFSFIHSVRATVSDRLPPAARKVGRPGNVSAWPASVSSTPTPNALADFWTSFKKLVGAIWAWTSTKPWGVSCDIGPPIILTKVIIFRVFLVTARLRIYLRAIDVKVPSNLYNWRKCTSFPPDSKRYNWSKSWLGGTPDAPT